MSAMVSRSFTNNDRAGREGEPLRSHESSTAVSQDQAEFFDESPPLYPWPRLLRLAGLGRVCKPREAKWKQGFEDLALKPGDKVTVKRYHSDFRLVRNPRYARWHNLVTKLHWGQAPSFE